jgi:hypothetical protein
MHALKIKRSKTLPPFSYLSFRRRIGRGSQWASESWVWHSIIQHLNRANMQGFGLRNQNHNRILHINITESSFAIKIRQASMEMKEILRSENRTAVLKLEGHVVLWNACLENQPWVTWHSTIQHSNEWNRQGLGLRIQNHSRVHYLLLQSEVTN